MEDLKIYRVVANLKFAGRKTATIKGLVAVEGKTDARILKQKALERLETACAGNPLNPSVEIKKIKEEKFDFFLAL